MPKFLDITACEASEALIAATETVIKDGQVIKAPSGDVPRTATSEEIARGKAAWRSAAALRPKL